MGILRLFMALMVTSGLIGSIGFIWHGQTYDLQVMHASNFVYGFFAISGFYMALLMDKYQLKEKITWKNLKIFYFNRLLRIYPLYFLAIVLAFAYRPMRFELSIFSTLDAVWFLLSNFSALGLHILRYTNYSTTVHEFFLNASVTGMHDIPLGGRLFVPVAWTLSIQLVFFVLVPFIVRRGSLFVLLIMGLSFVYSYVDVQYQPAGHVDNILSTLYMFMMGIFVYMEVYPRVQLMNPRKIKYIAWITLIVLMIIGVGVNIKVNNTYMFFILIGMAFLFQHFKNSRLDRFIGYVSYPVFLFHQPFYQMLHLLYHEPKSLLFNRPLSFLLHLLWSPMQHIPFLNYNLLFLIFITVICGVITLGIQWPIDRWRHRNLYVTKYKKK